MPSVMNQASWVFFTTAAHCPLMLSLASTKTPRSLSRGTDGSQSEPHSRVGSSIHGSELHPGGLSGQGALGAAHICMPDLDHDLGLQRWSGHSHVRHGVLQPLPSPPLHGLAPAGACCQLLWVQHKFRAALPWQPWTGRPGQKGGRLPSSGTACGGMLLGLREV